MKEEILIYPLVKSSAIFHFLIEVNSTNTSLCNKSAVGFPLLKKTNRVIMFSIHRKKRRSDINC